MGLTGLVGGTIGYAKGRIDGYSKGLDDAFSKLSDQVRILEIMKI